MTKILFANEAVTTLSGSVSSGATTANLAAGSGAKFPSPGAGEYFLATFKDAATQLNYEIVKVTSRTADVVTIVRAQEGTSAQAWAAGDIFGNFWTAGSADAMLQQGQSQSQSQNFAIDTGAANAYVVALTPTVSTNTIGMPVRVFITHTNTTTSTLNVGAGAQTIVHAGTLAVLKAGDLVASSIYTFIWDGTNYQLLSPGQFEGDSGSGGKQGVVPAPAAADAAGGKALLASGLWGLINLSLQTIVTASIGASGYIKLGPIYIQWGATSCSADGGSASVTWPVVFPTACLFAICSQNTDTTSSLERSGCAIFSKSTSGATVSNNATITTTIGWLAIGN